MTKRLILHARPQSLLLQQEALPDVLTLRGSPGMEAEIKTDDMDSETVAALRGVIADGNWISLFVEIGDGDE